MSVLEKLISEQNQYDLFYNILLSIKSKNPSVSIIEDKSKSKCKLESNSISIASYKENKTKTDISSFSIVIDREEKSRLFSKNTYSYNIEIHGKNRGYSSFNRMNFGSELMSNRCSQVIGDIFDYLFDVEEQRKIDQTNNAIRDIIYDISTTVDKAYKRDNKIDEVLNN
jgi:hypothetical protein